MAREGAARVCVGCDGRLSSPSLEAALVDGLRAGGAQVLRIGLGPTPMLSFSVFEFEADAGIMVTGSHNPPKHNGFKLTLGGRPFFGEDLTALGALAKAGDYRSGEGRVEDAPVAEAYVARLVRSVEMPSGLRMAWDAGNGAAGEVLSALTAKLPGEHILLNETIDGTFPGHHPDPTVPENLVQLQDTVRDSGCGLGIAFDGDGDRIGVIDGAGRILWGDQLVAILARDVLAANPGAMVIADVKCSDALFEEVTRLGGVPLLWQVGHSHIKAKMKETGAPLAGEMSGHIFFADEYYGFDDALYAGLRLLRVLARTGETLAALRDALPALVNTPELRFECDDERKFDVVTEVRDRLTSNGADVNDIDGVRVSTADGWWLLRPSNTQAVLVARCEARDEAGLARLKAEMVAQLRLSGIDAPV
jgi:phosphomannomutase